MAYKVFTNGSVLNASEINDNLMNQSVMVFSNAAARTSAITSPLEGMLTWLQDSNKYQNYNGSAWVDLGSSGILQVKSTAKTDTATRSSTTFDDISGLSVTITPSSTSSKIYVLAQCTVAAGSNAAVHLRLRRDSTDIYLGDTAGSRVRVSVAEYVGAENRNNSQVISFVDSPNTTSAITYKVQWAGSAAQAIYLNRTVTDTDASNFPRSASSITVMEVAG